MDDPSEASMASAHEKYPAWTIDRIERRAPRRASSSSSAELDGKREYAIMKCVHGCGVELAMLANKKQKTQVIEDHLAVCTGIDGAHRPTKKPRAISLASAKDRAKCAKLVPALHAGCDARISSLEKEVEEQEASLGSTKASLASTNAELASTNAKLASTNTELAATNAKVDALNGRVASLETGQARMLELAADRYGLNAPVDMSNVCAKVALSLVGPPPGDMTERRPHMTTEQRAWIERTQMRGVEIARCNLAQDLTPICAFLEIEGAKNEESMTEFVLRVVQAAARRGVGPYPQAAGAWPPPPAWTGPMQQPVAAPAAPAAAPATNAFAATFAELERASDATECGSVTGASCGSRR